MTVRLIPPSALRLPTLLFALFLIVSSSRAAEPPLRVGFGHEDITPEIGDRPVWMAGFGNNRRATGVHDPLGARAVVLDEIGYIIPKSQWDVESPFCFGRKKSQYGESNSLGLETAPILCEALRGLLTE